MEKVIHNNIKLPFLTLLLLILSGCQPAFGPGALRNTHTSYNTAIVTTLNEQMLLNLLRARYLDTSYFLEIGSVTASLSFGANLGLNTELDLGPGGNLLEPNIGIRYADSPTISYTPLRGEDFLKSVLSPISLEALLVMTQSGWSIERVFGICLERINDLPNAPTASGPTPQTAPSFEKFKRLLMLLRELQLKGLIEIGPDLEQDTQKIVVLLEADPAQEWTFEELRELLGIADEDTRFTLSSNFLDTSNHVLAARPRSIVSILHYLSQNVEIPEKDRRAGLVTITKTDSGEDFDWSKTPAGGAFRVNASEERPDNAFVAVPYRGSWFYISDTDIQSKATFKLLTQLFNLQAGQTKAIGPTLTLPVGAR